MNETTDKLIRELADKLGTTTEHLWGVLIRQATISGVTNMVMWVGCFALLLLACKITVNKTRVPPATESNKYPHAEWEDAAVALWIILGFATLAVGVAFLTGIESTIGALLNPEYWALKQIIK